MCAFELSDCKVAELVAEHVEDAHILHLGRAAGDLEGAARNMAGDQCGDSSRLGAGCARLDLGLRHRGAERRVVRQHEFIGARQAR